jgi:EpsI family protein
MSPYPRAIGAAVLILAAAGLAQAMMPREMMARGSGKFDLQEIVPRQFGDWSEVPGAKLVVPSDPNALANLLYSQEFGRAYRDREGHVVMLMVAYGPSQSDRLQLHRPEVCYVSEGFRVSATTVTQVPLAAGSSPLKLTRVIAQRPQRFEPISYWMRVGDEVATGTLDRQLIKLKYGLRGIIPDGTLVRVSTIGLPEAEAFAVQNRFIRDLVAAVPAEYRNLLIGAPPPPHEVSSRSENKAL